MRDEEKENGSRSTGEEKKKHEPESTIGGCIRCGVYVPEGRDVCPVCERGGGAHGLGRIARKSKIQ